ncbi:anti-H(O) lectin 1-like, partial [Abrus precatorius]|uniref:Anti-H(O) lectin 1-like n=1 Tax=Abrus precatorius TaxID=3816 RepID=A0A8B8M773_ABRPR
MAINSRTQTESLVSVLTIIISFVMLTQTVKSVSFTFPSFGSYTNQNDITFQGDTSLVRGAIELTGAAPKSAGRASYAAPVQLWDAKTGKLASFTTSFSFVVAPNGPGLFGDGIAFFIAPFNSNIPQNSSGGFLGLFSANTALNAYQNQLVAVEFDSFPGNPWDPSYSHVGIDVNSIASVTTTKWEAGNDENGFIAFATVNYEPITKNLSVLVSYPHSYVNGTSSSLSFAIDLRTILPEWVRIGFSGATGQLVEIHKIHSWTFSSNLSDHVTNNINNIIIN